MFELYVVLFSDTMNLSRRKQTTILSLLLKAPVYLRVDPIKEELEKSRRNLTSDFKRSLTTAEVTDNEISNHLAKEMT